MSLPKARLYQAGEVIDYTAGANKSGGAVVLLDDGRCGILVNDVLNGYQIGAVAQGIMKVEKKNEAIAAGADVYYDADGDPYGGTAGSGAATAVPCKATGDLRMGRALAAAAATATHLFVVLNAVAGPNLGHASANTADSAEVENTAVETAFDKKATLKGSALRAGDVIRVRAQGRVVDNNGADTLTVKLYLGTEEIVTTGAVDAADEDVFHIDADIVVRIAGAGGHVAACGTVALGVPGTVTAKPFRKADAAEDLSGEVDVVLKATWSAAHADNEVLLENLTVQVIPQLVF